MLSRKTLSMTIKTAGVAMLCAANFVAHAQWEKEPSMVMGVRLGVPLAKSGIEECPKLKGLDHIMSLCYEKNPYSNEMVSLRGTPDLGFFYSASLRVRDGDVSALSMNFHHDSFDDAVSMFTERYGRPQKIDPGTVTTIGGAVLRSQLLLWKGKEMNLTVLERVNDIDSSAAMFSDANMDKMRQLEESEKHKAAASKL